MLQAEVGSVWHQNVFGAEETDGSADSVGDPRALHLEAYIEDNRADLYATVILPTVDNALQQLSRAYINRERASEGFGQLINGVPLTKLLRATTNCIRHADEWDDNPYLQVPYDKESLDRAVEKTVQKHGKDFVGTDEQKELIRSPCFALKTIRVLQHALGTGRHDRIHDAPTWAVLKIIDGKFTAGKAGTSDPDYGRFEKMILSAAREIIEEGKPTELLLFDTQFDLA